VFKKGLKSFSSFYYIMKKFKSWHFYAPVPVVSRIKKIHQFPLLLRARLPMTAQGATTPQKGGAASASQEISKHPRKRRKAHPSGRSEDAPLRML